MKNVILSLEKISQSISDAPEFGKLTKRSMRSKTNSVSKKD